MKQTGAESTPLDSSAPFLEIADLHKSFGETEVLRGIDLAVASGEILALLGRSGSGKSTLLRTIAGFEVADRGSLRLEGREFNHKPPQQRAFGMVFQSYALFPHLTVAENVAFGLDRTPSMERSQRVAEMLELVQLSELGERSIDEISGGQQQRVALARALAPSPRLLLLDEPLSNLDPNLRDQTRQELLRIVRSVGTTTLLVTHEQEEAFELGDRVAVLEAGRIEQVATPVELYRDPATPFVAGFIGRANWLGCQVVESEPAVVAVEGFRGGLALESGASVGGAVEGLAAESDSAIWVRPEGLSLEADSTSTAPTAQGEVIGCRFVGSYVLVSVRLDSGQNVECAHPDPLSTGSAVTVSISRPASVRMIARPPGAGT